VEPKGPSDHPYKIRGSENWIPPLTVARAIPREQGYLPTKTGSECCGAAKRSCTLSIFILLKHQAELLQSRRRVELVLLVYRIPARSLVLVLSPAPKPGHILSAELACALPLYW
jgi:hypothetical protein